MSALAISKMIFSVTLWSSLKSYRRTRRAVGACEGVLQGFRPTGLDETAGGGGLEGGDGILVRWRPGWRGAGFPGGRGGWRRQGARRRVVVLAERRRRCLSPLSGREVGDAGVVDLEDAEFRACGRRRQRCRVLSHRSFRKRISVREASAPGWAMSVPLKREVAKLPGVAQETGGRGEKSEAVEIGVAQVVEFCRLEKSLIPMLRVVS